MEFLDKIIEQYPLPSGYSWEYYYRQSHSNPYDGWDNLRVVDKSGHEVGDNIIHGVRDYFQWTRTAQKNLEDIQEKLENDRFRKEMMNPTSKIEDMGESKTYEYSAEELKSITPGIKEKPKKRGLWW